MKGTRERKTKSVRSVRCPVCGRGKLLRASMAVNDFEIQTYPNGERHAATFYLKCPTCKSQIGIEFKL